MTPTQPETIPPVVVRILRPNMELVRPLDALTLWLYVLHGVALTQVSSAHGYAAVVPKVPLPTNVKVKVFGAEEPPVMYPETRTYRTAASTTVIATNRIVAIIGDTPRFLALFTLLLNFIVHTFSLTRPNGPCVEEGKRHIARKFYTPTCWIISQWSVRPTHGRDAFIDWTGPL